MISQLHKEMRLWIGRGQQLGVKKTLQERNDLIASQKVQAQNDK